MWINPLGHEKAPKRTDWNKKYKEELKGELSDEKGMSTLGKFLSFNIQFTIRILTGIILKPFQAVMIKAWMEKNFSLVCWGRAMGKSSMIGLFSIFYGMTHPGQTILIVSSNFRSSRRILEGLELLSKRNPLLHQIFDGDLSRRNDIFQWVMFNGSKIVCLPLANGEGLRGQRANVLIVDEALLVPKHIIENVLKPFLAASSNITEKLQWREKEDKLIAAGKMKEEDRRKFPSTSKMILLSSASYQGEYFHEVYLDYLKKITTQESEEASYFVTQMSYEVMQSLAPEILDKGVIEDIESGNTPQSVIDREYKAQFIQGNEGFFRAVKLKACTVPDGGTPCVEIVGESGAEYVLGIDPNMGGDETNDHFAMSVLKIVKKPDGRKIGLLVHSYAAAGVDLKDHILYLIYILRHFNIIYIAVDTTQGDNSDFISICNESDLFKGEKLRLEAIEAEFGREDETEIAKQIKKSYNLKASRIVQKQNFHSAFLGASNDHLQACVDFGNIMFAGKALAIDGQVEIMSSQDIGDIYKKHKLFAEFKEGNPMFSFIELQDELIDMTKNEMAHIQVTVSNLGNRSFSLPQNIRRVKSKTRTRRDNYSSLLLANWGLKLYNSAMDMEVKTYSTTFSPFLA
jgi:hypothetical protein